MTAIKKRDSSIELLRIIAMIMIIMHHYSVHGGFMLDDAPMSVNRYILTLCLPIGKWAVNLFIVIFGYFGVKSVFKIERIARLYSQVWLYSAGIAALYMMRHQELHLGIALTEITPIISNKYWFFSQYIVLSLLVPFLNKLIDSITRGSHLKLIFILLFVWSILPSFLPELFEYGLGVTSIGIFVLLYLVGAYIRLYPDCSVCNYKNGWFLTVGSIVFMMLIQLEKCIYDIVWIDFDCGSVSATASICFAVGMFVLFKNMSIKENKIINTVASCTFGIYLIHDNHYIRQWLWLSLLKNSNYFESDYLIPHLIISTVVVFMVCMVIELIRQKTVDSFYKKYLEKYFLKFIDHICAFCNRVFRFNQQ